MSLSARLRMLSSVVISITTRSVVKAAAFPPPAVKNIQSMTMGTTANTQRKTSPSTDVGGISIARKIIQIANQMQDDSKKPAESCERMTRLGVWSEGRDLDDELFCCILRSAVSACYVLRHLPIGSVR